jgi:hypothetical protein
LADVNDVGVGNAIGLYQGLNGYIVLEGDARE